MKRNTIAGLAAAAGVGVETVRYYQRRGLLRTPAAEGAVRRYGEDDLRRLRFVRAAQAAGFTLEQVAELLALDGGRDQARVRAITEAQIAVLDARIAALSHARDRLGALARECRGGGRRSCPILAAFDQGWGPPGTGGQAPGEPAAGGPGPH